MAAAGITGSRPIPPPPQAFDSPRVHRHRRRRPSLTPPTQSSSGSAGRPGAPCTRRGLCIDRKKCLLIASCRILMSPRHHHQWVIRPQGILRRRPRMPAPAARGELQSPHPDPRPAAALQSCGLCDDWPGSTEGVGRCIVMGMCRSTSKELKSGMQRVKCASTKKFIYNQIMVRLGLGLTTSNPYMYLMKVETLFHYGLRCVNAWGHPSSPAVLSKRVPIRRPSGECPSSLAVSATRSAPCLHPSIMRHISLEQQQRYLPRRRSSHSSSYYSTQKHT